MKSIYHAARFDQRIRRSSLTKTYRSAKGSNQPKSLSTEERPPPSRGATPPRRSIAKNRFEREHAAGALIIGTVELSSLLAISPEASPRKHLLGSSSSDGRSAGLDFPRTRDGSLPSHSLHPYHSFLRTSTRRSKLRSKTPTRSCEEACTEGWFVPPTSTSRRPGSISLEAIVLPRQQGISNS